MADYTNLKKSLEEMLQKKKQDKEQEESMRREKNESDRNKILENISGDLSKSLQPVLADLAKNSKLSTDEIRGALAEAIQISVPEIKVPEIKMPDYPVFNVPQPKVTVNFDSSKIRVPEVVMPDMMDVRGMVGLQGIDMEHPLPVQLRDKDGKYVDLATWTTQVIGGSGGKADFFTVKGILNTIGMVTVNPDGTPTYTSSSTGLTNTELRASSVPVEQVSGSTWSTYITGANGTLASNMVDSSGVAYSGSNPVPITIVSGGTATTAVQNLNADGTYRDTFPVQGTVTVASITATVGTANIDSSGVQFSGSNPFPMRFVSGAYGTAGVNIVDSSGVAYSSSNPVPIDDAGGAITVDGSVAVTGITGSIGATILNGEGLARDSWLISDVTNSIKASLIDSSGVQYSGSNPVPISDAGGTITIDGTVAVSGITNTVGANVVDSSGVAYTTTNPVPVTLATALDATIDSISTYQASGANFSVVVTGSTGTTVVVGDIASDVADTESNPLKIGGIARTANPTAVSAGDRTSATFDDIGRIVTRPVHVRDLIKTAYVTEDEIGEVALLTGVSGEYHDLIYVLASNESTGAINLDLRQTTGGTVQMSIEVPANSTSGVSLSVPIPQDHADATWTVKNSASDNSNTVYSVTALFAKEV